MKLRKLGNSEYMVSPLSIGCWSFGGGSYWGEQSQKDVDEVVNEALDQGVNLFDTAESYNDGASEISLGKALKGRRQEAVIVTKQMIHADQDDTIARLDESLKRMGTEYVDILMVHWPIADQKAMERVFRRCESLKESGKVKALGVSNFGVEQMKFMSDCGFTPCVNELHYNIASRAIDYKIKPICMEKGIGIITYVSLQQGVLTGKYKTLDDIPPKHARYRHFMVARSQGLNNHEGPGAEKELEALLEKMRQICGDTGLTMAELSLGWALRQPGIASAIVGCRNIGQLRDNLKALDVTIDDQMNEELLEASRPLMEKLGESPDYVKPLSKTRVH